MSLRKLFLYLSEKKFSNKNSFIYVCMRVYSSCVNSGKKQNGVLNVKGETLFSFYIKIK